MSTGAPPAVPTPDQGMLTYYYYYYFLRALYLELYLFSYFNRFVFGDN